MGSSRFRYVCLILSGLSLMTGRGAEASRAFGAGTAAPEETHAKKTDDALAGAQKLFREHKYEQALELVDKAMEDSGETVELLEFKDDLLWKLERHEARIDNVLRLEEISERKSPWNCLKLAEAYLRLGRKDEALHWMETAVEERGFRRAGTFELPVYDSVRGDERFAAVVARAYENMGIGRTVPDITVRLLDGGELTLSSLKGKVTLLDFWASWCIPCRKEIPNLKKLYKKYHDQGFEIVGISLDQDRAKALEYIEKNDLRWPISWSQEGYLGEPARLYTVNSLPSMWLIDREGILRQFNLKGDELRKSIEKLLSDESPR